MSNKDIIFMFFNFDILKFLEIQFNFLYLIKYLIIDYVPTIIKIGIIFQEFTYYFECKTIIFTLLLFIKKPINMYFIISVFDFYLFYFHKKYFSHKGFSTFFRASVVRSIVIFHFYLALLLLCFPCI